MLNEDTLDRMKESLSIADLESHIVGAKVNDSLFGPGTVINCDHKLGAVSIDYGGKIHNMAFPHAFRKQIKFESNAINQYVQAKVNCYLATMELGAAMGIPSFLYSMYVLTLGTDTAEARDKAFDYLYRAALAGDDTAQHCLLGNCSRRIEENELVDDEIIQFALQITEKQAEEGDEMAMSLIADYYYVTQNYKQAEIILKQIVDDEQIDDETKSDDAARLAGMYFTGKRGSTPEQSVYKNYQLAKRYYAIAARGGYDCSADLAYVNNALGITSHQNAMKIMAQQIVDARYSKVETYDSIVSDLRDEFGALWDTLPVSSQIDLISGCVVYCDLYSLGDVICRNIDFSAAIIPIVKAAEVVFRQYLCYGYYDYLQAHNVSHERFAGSHPFVEYDKQSRRYKYRDKDSIVFTLGSIKHLIIDPYQHGVHTEFLAYANELMGEKFASQSILKDYLTRLSQKMAQFTFNIRNPAAHSEIMPQWQAEICGNEIILVRKILKDFVSKIS